MVACRTMMQPPELGLLTKAEEKTLQCRGTRMSDATASSPDAACQKQSC